MYKVIVIVVLITGIVMCQKDSNFIPLSQVAKADTSFSTPQMPFIFKPEFTYPTGFAFGVAITLVLTKSIGTGLTSKPYFAYPVGALIGGLLVVFFMEGSK